jgi:predicted transcriptional regulator
MQQIRHMRTSVAAAAGGSSGEQQATGTLEQMSVNDLQQILSNPVLVGDDV